MPRFDLEGADRITVGTSDTTMRIWLELEQAGDLGLSRGEIHELVGPHVNAGFARRRYLRDRQQQRAYKSNGFRAARNPDPTWETTDVTRARDFIVTKTLSNMKRNGTVLVGGDERYRAGRKPRFERDESIIDLTGDRTRLHMNSANALRALAPAMKRMRESPHAQMTSREKEAFLRLVELHKEILQRGL